MNIIQTPIQTRIGSHISSIDLKQQQQQPITGEIRKNYEYETIRFQMPFSICSDHKQHTEFIDMYLYLKNIFFSLKDAEHEWKMIKFTLYPGIQHQLIFNGCFSFQHQNEQIARGREK